MAINDQYLPGHEPFGMAGIAQTGASGNPSALPSSNAPVLASNVTVSVVGQSSQVAPDTATITVGDTASASFGPIPENGDPLTGISAAMLTSTGAGQGQVGGPGNPNAMNIDSLARQVDAMRRPR